MADTRYLKQRRLGWYSRVPVPRALQNQLGKTHIERTLQTRDLSTAQRRRWKHVQEAQADFEFQRRATGEGLTPADIEEHAWQAYEQMLADAEEQGLDDEGIDLHISVLGDQLDAGRLDVLAEAVAWAKLAALNGRRAAMRGQPYQPPVSFGSHGIDRLTLKPVVVAHQRHKARGTGGAGAGSTPGESLLRFSDAAQRYLAEAQRDSDAALTGQTVAQSESVFRLFREFSRDATLEDVTRAMAGEFLETVSTLDPDWGRSGKTKESSLKKLLEQYGGHPKGLSNRTLNRYSTTAGRVFRWARKRGLYDGINPFEGQSRKAATTGKTGWLSIVRQT